MRPQRSRAAATAASTAAELLDVGRVQPGGPPGRLDLEHERLERLPPAADQHHVCPFGGESLCDREPDPLAGSGDDDVLPFETARRHGAPLT